MHGGLLWGTHNSINTILQTKVQPQCSHKSGLNKRLISKK